MSPAAKYALTWVLLLASFIALAYTAGASEGTSDEVVSCACSCVCG